MAARNLPHRGGQRGPRDFQRPVEARQRVPADQPLLAGDEAIHAVAARIDADPIGHVEREEIARRQEGIDRFQADVVGVDEIRRGPAAGHYGGAGLGLHVGRATAGDRMLAVRLVPDGRDLDPLAAGQNQRIQLRRPLMAKTIADAE